MQRKIEAHPEYGLEVVGLPRRRRPRDRLRRSSGARTRSREIVDEYEIDRVLLASSVGSHEETLDLVRAVRRPDVQVSIVPRYFEIFTSHSTLDDVEGMPVVTLPPMRLGRSARVLKRSVDVVVVGHRAARALAACSRCSRSLSGWTARARRSTGSRGAAGSARRSRSSSSGRCTSARSSVAAKSCT